MARNPQTLRWDNEGERVTGGEKVLGMVNRDLTLRRTNERGGIPPQSFRPIASRNHGLPETHRTGTYGS
jgi:hypothetical protein